jgi:hypothetical protein
MAANDAKDLLGHETTAAERRLLEAYRALLALLAEPGLPPCAVANLKEAAAAMWQVVNDLALVDERPDL